ncbi:MAG: nucleotide exchange factor GrpE, partial [Acidimicrobiia bacterium]|nr:nucleotide exchange factor GrpE [Acidimicrobiia bacterium]
MSDHTADEQADDADVVNEAEVVEAELVATTDSAGIEVPDDPEQAVEVLMTALMEARGESESYLDDLQRVAADFDNYRKRIQREQAELVAGSTKRLVLELLVV